MICNSIQAGADVSGVTAAASDVRSTKKFVNSNGELISGTVATKTSSNVTVSGRTVTIPAGIYDSQVSKSIATATQATPVITVNSDGLIKATCTQDTGYLGGGVKNATLQLSSSHDSDFVASNIKSGVSIFGVTGTYEGKGLVIDSLSYSNNVEYSAGFIISPSQSIRQLQAFAYTYTIAPVGTTPRYFVSVYGDNSSGSIKRYVCQWSGGSSNWIREETGQMQWGDDGTLIIDPSSADMGTVNLLGGYIAYNPA